MGITRRSLLQLMTGAAAGVAVSPLPWKLIDDVGIWTQNWFLTPKLLRGPTSWKEATCGLCGGACGIRVRFRGDVPIAVTGRDDHPLSLGGVCPVGLGGPGLRYHPTRAVKPVMRNASGELRQATAREVLARVGEKLSGCRAKPEGGRLAILDWRPGGAMTAIYRQLLDGVGGGLHLTPALGETAADLVAAGSFDGAPGRVGYDFEGAKTVLSFGAPLLEGYGGPGRMAAIQRRWNALPVADQPRLIQADANHTVTASHAARWLSIEPGTETALALGIGNVLLGEKLVDASALAGRIEDLDAYRALVADFTPERVAGLTGLRTKQIIETARALAENGPAIAVGGGGPGSGPLGRPEEQAIFALNMILGSYGVAGGVLPLPAWPPVVPAPVAPPPAAEEEPDTEVAPAPLPVPAPRLAGKVATGLDEVDDKSIGVLIVDGALPEGALPRRLLERKLADGGITVSLSPYLAGANLDADVILPAAVAGEWEQDLVAPSGSPRGSYAMAAALTSPPPGTTPPPELVGLLAEAGGVKIAADAYATALSSNLEAIIAAGRGQLFDGKSGQLMDVGSVKTADKLHKALRAGGCWLDDPLHLEKAGSCRLLGKDPDAAKKIGAVAAGRVSGLGGSAGQLPLTLMPYGARTDASEAALPQLMTKIYRETGLRRSPASVLIHPETAAARKLADGCRAALTTAAGRLEVEVLHDRATRPGVVRVAVGPSPLSLGDVDKGEYGSVLDLVELPEDPVWRLSRANLEEVRHG